MTRSASASSRVRAAMNSSGSPVSPVSMRRVSAAVACHHCCRDRATSYRRALSIAVPAVAARAWASCSSSALNPPRVLSVR